MRPGNQINYLYARQSVSQSINQFWLTGVWDLPAIGLIATAPASSFICSLVTYYTVPP